jgi:hypothetical protein
VADVLALQRSAGNAAVARLLQRQLHITDDSGKKHILDDRERARNYLERAYVHVYISDPVGEQAERLEELADEAELTNNITAATLDSALRYIRRGGRLMATRGYVNPGRSPDRGPRPTDSHYRMKAAQPPKRLKAPQSPLGADAHEMDIDATLRERFGVLDTARADFKVPPKKNLFSYTVHAVYRLVNLQLGDDRVYRETGTVTMHEAKAHSPVYQSAYKLLPGDPEAEGADVEGGIRSGLETLRAAAHAYPTSSGTTFASHPAGKFTDPGDEGGYKFKGAMPYAHSETQAFSQVATDAPRLATQLLNAIVATARGAPGRRPLAIVVQKVDLVGASTPNSVCANACKHAVRLITDQIELAVTNERHRLKAELATEQLYIRGSSQLTTAGHVQGIKSFQGRGKMGDQTVPAGEPGHLVTVEYDPPPD